MKKLIEAHPSIDTYAPPKTKGILRAEKKRQEIRNLRSQLDTDKLQFVKELNRLNNEKDTSISFLSNTNSSKYAQNKMKKSNQFFAKTQKYKKGILNMSDDEFEKMFAFNLNESDDENYKRIEKEIEERPNKNSIVSKKPKLIAPDVRKSNRRNRSVIGTQTLDPTQISKAKEPIDANSEEKAKHAPRKKAVSQSFTDTNETFIEKNDNEQQLNNNKQSASAKSDKKYVSPYEQPPFHFKRNKARPIQKYQQQSNQRQNQNVSKATNQNNQPTQKKRPRKLNAVPKSNHDSNIMNKNTNGENAENIEYSPNQVESNEMSTNTENTEYGQNQVENNEISTNTDNIESEQNQVESNEISTNAENINSNKESNQNENYDVTDSITNDENMSYNETATNETSMIDTENINDKTSQNHSEDDNEIQRDQMKNNQIDKIEQNNEINSSIEPILDETQKSESSQVKSFSVSANPHYSINNENIPKNQQINYSQTMPINTEINIQEEPNQIEYNQELNQNNISNDSNVQMKQEELDPQQTSPGTQINENPPLQNLINETKDLLDFNQNNDKILPKDNQQQISRSNENENTDLSSRDNINAKNESIESSYTATNTQNANNQETLKGEKDSINQQTSTISYSEGKDTNISQEKDNIQSLNNNQHSASTINQVKNILPENNVDKNASTVSALQIDNSNPSPECKEQTENLKTSPDSKEESEDLKQSPEHNDKPQNIKQSEHKEELENLKQSQEIKDKIEYLPSSERIDQTENTKQSSALKEEPENFKQSTQISKQLDNSKQTTELDEQSENEQPGIQNSEQVNQKIDVMQPLDNQIEKESMQLVQDNKPNKITDPVNDQQNKQSIENNHDIQNGDLIKGNQIEDQSHNQTEFIMNEKPAEIKSDCSHSIPTNINDYITNEPKIEANQIINDNQIPEHIQENVNALLDNVDDINKNEIQKEKERKLAEYQINKLNAIKNLDPNNLLPNDDDDEYTWRTKLHAREAQLAEREARESAREAKHKLQEASVREREAELRLRVARLEQLAAQQEAESAKNELEKDNEIMTLMKEHDQSNEVPPATNNESKPTIIEDEKVNQHQSDQNANDQIHNENQNEVKLNEEDNETELNENINSKEMADDNTEKDKEIDESNHVNQIEENKEPEIVYLPAYLGKTQSGRLEIGNDAFVQELPAIVENKEPEPEIIYLPAYSGKIESGKLEIGTDAFIQEIPAMKSDDGVEAKKEPIQKQSNLNNPFAFNSEDDNNDSTPEMVVKANENNPDQANTEHDNNLSAQQETNKNDIFTTAQENDETSQNDNEVDIFTAENDKNEDNNNEVDIFTAENDKNEDNNNEVDIYTATNDNENTNDEVDQSETNESVNQEMQVNKVSKEVKESDFIMDSQPDNVSDVDSSDVQEDAKKVNQISQDNINNENETDTEMHENKKVNDEETLEAPIESEEVKSAEEQTDTEELEDLVSNEEIILRNAISEELNGQTEIENLGKDEQLEDKSNQADRNEEPNENNSLLNVISGQLNEIEKKCLINSTLPTNLDINDNRKIDQNENSKNLENEKDQEDEALKEAIESEVTDTETFEEMVNNEESNLVNAIIEEKNEYQSTTIENTENHNNDEPKAIEKDANSEQENGIKEETNQNENELNHENDENNSALLNHNPDAFISEDSSPPKNPNEESEIKESTISNLDVDEGEEGDDEDENDLNKSIKDLNPIEMILKEAEEIVVATTENNAEFANNENKTEITKTENDLPNTDNLGNNDVMNTTQNEENPVDEQLISKTISDDLNDIPQIMPITEPKTEAPSIRSRKLPEPVPMKNRKSQVCRLPRKVRQQLFGTSLLNSPK